MIIIEPMSICKECYSPSLMHQSTNSLESSPHKTISAQVVLLNTMGESFVLCVYILFLQRALILLVIKMSFIKYKGTASTYYLDTQLPCSRSNLKTMNMEDIPCLFLTLGLIKRFPQSKIGS